MRNVPGTEYISYHKNKKLFSITKTINGERKVVGTAKTLIQALMVRDWCRQNNWEHYPKRTCGLTGEKYITMNKKGRYIVSKMIKGKTHHYGSFKTLPEAIEYRDFIVAHGWSTNHRYRRPLRNIQKTKHGNYKVYKMINGVNTYFGTYHSLEEAIEVRRLVEKYNGDWDLMVEEPFEEETFLDDKICTDIMFDTYKARNDYFLIKNGGFS